MLLLVLSITLLNLSTIRSSLLVVIATIMISTLIMVVVLSIILTDSMILTMVEGRIVIRLTMAMVLK